jgi:hypothetical protein
MTPMPQLQTSAQFQTPMDSGAPVVSPTVPMIPSGGGLGCVGCPRAMQGINFGADPVIASTGWPMWAKVLVGVTVLGFVVGGVTLFARRSLRSHMYY